MNLLRSSARRRHPSRLRRASARLVAVTAAAAVALPLSAVTTAAPASAAAADDDVLRVLLFSSGDQVHGSVANTRAAVKELSNSLAVEYGLDGNTGDPAQAVADIQETTNASAFTADNLATKDVLVFAHTAGVLFTPDQRTALEAYIRGGGGFVGIHYTGWSPDQTEHDVNAFYHRLVGAAATGHPEPAGGQRGTVTVSDASSPLTAGLPSSLSYTDEWYEWDVNPTQDVRTLVTVDESSYPAGTRIGEEGTSHPVTWCQKIDEGRSWYSSLGHHASAYTAADDGANAGDNQADDFVRAQLRSGIAYSAALLPADCSPPKKDEQGSWSDVTPWPLMPINAALTSDGKVQSFGSVGSGCTDANPYDYSGNDCVTQGGQTQIDVWDPKVVRTVGNLVAGVIPNATYTDLFCSMQVQMPHRRSTFTVGGDDGLGGNAPNDAAIGVTSYATGKGLKNEAPMNFPRWYPTGTTLPNGSVVVQGGSLRGGPGGPGVLTPEVYDPKQGSSWKLLTGATSALAYGDGGNGNGPDENRWWYPRAFVAPTNGSVFNISGTQMTELVPSADDGAGAIIDRGVLGNGSGNQGNLGNPVGATSTATMYRPGKILQVGGGWWANGGGPAGARAGFTVDISGGTASPVVAATDPMKYGRHWASSTVMPDGKVLVTGGSRDNNGQAGYVTNPEIWDPEAPSGSQWTEVEVPYEHARLYHSTALLLPDGRIMVGGGGAPGPHNYTDVEYYSPAYLFDGDQAAVRPVVTNAPKKVGYNGTFTLSSDKPVERVTLVRNGSVTHGFNNDQNFQDLSFTQSGGTVSITSPADANYAPPGAYMVFVWSDGVPSVANIVQIDPQVKVESPAPTVVDQFEYPRLPATWQSGTYDSVQVAAGNSRMSPWVVAKQVQLIRANAGGMGGLGLTGYHLSLGTDGDLTRTLKGLDVGKEYRLSVRYARDNRAAGTAPGTASLSIAGLDATLSADPGTSSNSSFATYVGTFTATARQQDLRITGTGVGVVLDDLVVVGSGLGVADAQVTYAFEEGTGTTAANTGSDTTVGDATLVGTTGWSPNGTTGGALDLKGGSNANTVDLPDNLLQNEGSFTTSFWVKPDTKANWINLFHIGDGLEGAGSFFQIQMQTDAAPGGTGLAATFKKKGSNLQERIYASPTKDVTAGQWNHVVFTRQGSTGTLYLNGAQIASRNDLTLTMTDVGPTTNNWLGRNGYPDPSFDGLMDDVRLWTTALSDADVAGLYADGSALATTTTVTTSPASPSEFDTPITVSATVKDAANANPTGVAELWIDGASQGSQVTVTDGQVSFPAVTLAPRQHSIEVRFIAAAGWRDSVGTAQHTVSRPPVGEGIPVHYTFDEGTGTTAANSGSDPAIGNGVFQGNAGWSTDGKYGGALNLPGEGHVQLPNDITEGMDEEITISTWIRPTNLPNWTTHAQIGKGQNEFLLLQSEWDNGQGGFAVTVRNDNGEQYRTTLPGTTDLPLGQWTHVAVTMGPSPTGTGSTVKIYFDGVLKQTRNNIPVTMADLNAGGTNANFIGNGSWPDPRPTERIDDFRIYGYALSAEDVLAVFNGTTNVAPVGVADAYTTTAGAALVVAAPGVLANDTDAEGATLTATGLTQPDDGVVTMAADGSFTYTPDTGFTGTNTFTYTAYDGTTASAPTTVTITVGAAPNAAPIAVDNAYEVIAGQELVLGAPGVLGNDTDADGDPLTSTKLSDPINGSVVLAGNGSFTYKPDGGFTGKDTFTYRVSDGTATSGSATVRITVKPAGGSGDSPAASAVAGASAPFTYGKVGSVAVGVSPAAATGKVELVDGGQVIASGNLASGQVRLELAAKGLLPGAHPLTLRYLGDTAHKASSSQVQVVVEKVVPRMSVKAPDTVKKGKKVTVKVSLSAPDDVPVAGTVSVAIKGGRTVTGTLRAGKVVLTLPKAVKGKLRLTVTYSGSDLAEKVVDTATVKVSKRKSNRRR